MSTPDKAFLSLFDTEKKGKKEVDDSPKQVGGVYIFPNGDRYEGDVLKRNDGTLERSGYGVHTITNGVVYEGEWVGDVMCGRGRLTHPSGCVYEGQFNKNQFHGEGKYIWADGSYYEGQFCENKLEGNGSFTDTHGQTWEGTFMYKAAPGLRFNLRLD